MASGGDPLPRDDIRSGRPAMRGAAPAGMIGGGTLGPAAADDWRGSQDAESRHPWWRGQVVRFMDYEPFPRTWLSARTTCAAYAGYRLEIVTPLSPSRVRTVTD